MGEQRTWTTEEKKQRLKLLAEKRKGCDACAHLRYKATIKLFNAAQEPTLDVDEMGPWTEWNGNPDAEYMIIGQDWGTKEYLEAFRKWQKENNNLPYESYDITNKNLAACIRMLNSDWDILKTDGVDDNTRYPLYFTNEILCYKYEEGDKAKMNAGIPAVCYRECAKRYLCEQIDIIEPKAIVLLGADTFRNFVRGAGKDRFNCDIDLNGNFGDVILKVLGETLRIVYKTAEGRECRVFPMWHTGGLGTKNAKMAFVKNGGSSDTPALEILKVQWSEMAAIVRKQGGEPWKILEGIR